MIAFIVRACPSTTYTAVSLASTTPPYFGRRAATNGP